MSVDKLPPPLVIARVTAVAVPPKVTVDVVPVVPQVVEVAGVKLTVGGLKQVGQLRTTEAGAKLTQFVVVFLALTR